MKSRLRSAKDIAQAVNGVAPSRHVCVSCQRSSFQRRYASAAAVAESPAEPSDLSSPSETTPAAHDAAPPGPRPAYRLNAGVVLSRPAVITRDLHPFEQAFFFYQRRLNDRLALPFSRYFYFKRGTPADIEWKRRQKERITPSRDIGRYDAYGKFGWNDELLVGAPESEPQHQVDALLKDAEAPAVGGGPEAGKEVGAEQAASTRVEVEKPMPRVTEADKRGDQKSLDRMLQRALYLLVQGADGSWVFPTARLEGSESLVEAAQRTLTQSAGPNMNTWIVGNVPIGHHAEDYETPVRGGADGQRYELGAKTFFVKGRIMTGQADVTDNLHGFKDFRWLAKEEIAQLVTPHYWRMTEDMLVER